MKKLLISAMLALGLAVPANAAINIIVNDSTALFNLDGGESGTPIAHNDFGAYLTGGGYNFMMTSVLLETSAPGRLEFYFLGAESAYRTSFYADSDTPAYEEAGPDEAWQGYDVTHIASITFDAPMSFTAETFRLHALDGPAMPLQGTMSEKFGVMYPGAADNYFGHNSLVFAFDDGGANNDQDFDDLLILTRFISIIPEPATWLMMILGFGLVGLTVRRRSAVVSS